MKKRTKRLLTASGIISAALLLASCTNKSEESGEYDPSINELEDVYGPPDMLEPEDDEFIPDENIAEPLYGPPASEKDAPEAQE